LWAWGVNGSGQLGINTTSSRSSPTQIGALTTWATGTVGGVSGGSTAAIKTDGTLWTWGKNDFGELGNNNVAARSSPVQVGSTPVSATSWSEVAKSDGQMFTAIIDTSGRLWTMGYNNYGMLGQNDTTPRSSPIQVGTDTNWSLVATGDYHVLARKSTGALWSWGQGGSGELGNSEGVTKSSPAQIGSLTNWSQIATGQDFSMAIKTDGTLWLWGSNDNGQIGNNSVALQPSSPVQIGSGTTWSSIAGGRKHAVAAKTDGTLWAFGYTTWGN
jgi:alpha-tubulin suppressor-like RCC1 family protein